jgi:hypothetical protein
MYGYHDKDSLFLKIHLYNPDLIKKYKCIKINLIVQSLKKSILLKDLVICSLTEA